MRIVSISLIKKARLCRSFFCQRSPPWAGVLIQYIKIQINRIHKIIHTADTQGAYGAVWIMSVRWTASAAEHVFAHFYNVSGAHGYQHVAFFEV